MPRPKSKPPRKPPTFKQRILFGPPPNDLTKYIGTKVAEARRQFGRSQAWLAKEINSQQSTVSDIEKGKNEMGVFMLTSLAFVLNKPVEYFFPPWFAPNLRANSLNDEEVELLEQFKVLEYETGGTAFAKDLLKFLANYYREAHEEANAEH